jgi:hypothetical protein
MSSIEELISDIDKLRESLYKVIETRGYDLNDPEVLEASRRLNTAITDFNDLLKDKVL